MSETVGKKTHEMPNVRTGPTAKKLLARLIAVGIATEDCMMQQHYPGYWQRRSGAWAWTCLNAQGLDVVGSQWSMTECLKLTDEKMEECFDWRI